MLELLGELVDLDVTKVCGMNWELGQTEEWWRGWSDTSARRGERNNGQIEAVADKNQKSTATGRDRELWRVALWRNLRAITAIGEFGCRRNPKATEGEGDCVGAIALNLEKSNGTSCDLLKPRAQSAKIGSAEEGTSANSVEVGTDLRK
ncbi:hypothetical protein BHM03_00052275 [Ensete ventricosum]|nr:hypothetical protein BHM03_00052275 [Ensete ventricosum]